VDSKKTVLHVDDVAMWRDYVKSLLGNEYDVMSCTDCHTALARVQSGGVDLIILDHLVPGSGPLSLGMELGAHLRRTHPELPVIVYTGAWRGSDGAEREDLEKKSKATVVFKHGRDPERDNLREQVHKQLTESEHHAEA
jgi:CheY-like chemotaxis protein